MVNPYKPWIFEGLKIIYPQDYKPSLAISILLSTGKWNMILLAGDILKK